MEQKDAIKIGKDIIQKGLKHPNYTRTVNLAKEYRAIITGKGADEYINKLTHRETEEEYNERKRLTVNLTETICGNIIDPQKKIPRSNSIERTFLYTDANKKKYDDLKDIIENFYEGRKSVDDYLSRSWIELNNTDPNALLVLDWRLNENGERIRPYPVEYSSENVYHFKKTNGEFDWVCVHRNETDFEPERYILYTKDYTVIYSRKSEIENWGYESDIYYWKNFPLEDYGIVATMKDEDHQWDIHIPHPHNIGHVPALHFGFVTDLSTRETYLSAIYKAMPILKKIIKANSELDITMAKHAFPQKIQFSKPCKECFGKGSRLEGDTCDNCKGTGTDPSDEHLTSLDTMNIPRPRDIEEMKEIDLSKLIHYVENNVELLKFQETYIWERLTKRCKEAVYNSEVFSRGDVAETATGKNIDLQNVYDALYDEAQAYASAHNFIVHTIAKIADLDKNLFYKINFRKDFKMKSLSDLYEDLATIGTSGAAEFVKEGTEDDIAQILYEGDERRLIKHKTMQYFFPFNGKSKKEIEIVTTNPELTKEETRILWANFEWIFDELDMEHTKKKIDFYQLTREKQKEAVDQKVKEIKEDIDKQKPKEVDVGETLQSTKNEAGRPPDETE